MDKIGDYKWHQMSQWDLSPENGVTKSDNINKTNVVCNYMLIRITSINKDGNGYTFEVCKTDENVPISVLNDKNTGYCTIVNHHAEYHPFFSLKDAPYY